MKIPKPKAIHIMPINYHIDRFNFFISWSNTICFLLSQASYTIMLLLLVLYKVYKVNLPN